MSTNPTKAELLVKINNLQQKIKDQDEIMYDKGIKKRETMLSAIEKVESDARNTIAYIVEDCEKRTGRKLTRVSSCKGFKLNYIPFKNDDTIDAMRYVCKKTIFEDVDWKTEINNALRKAENQRWSRMKTHNFIRQILRKY